MKFSKALEELDAGKKIRQHSWASGVYLQLIIIYKMKNINVYDGNGFIASFVPDAKMLLADDWEIVEDIQEVKLHIKEYFTCPSCNHDNIRFHLDDGISTCESCGQRVKTLPRCDRNGKKCIDDMKKYEQWLRDQIIQEKLRGFYKDFEIYEICLKKLITDE